MNDVIRAPVHDAAICCTGLILVSGLSTSILGGSVMKDVQYLRGKMKEG